MPPSRTSSRTLLHRFKLPRLTTDLELAEWVRLPLERLEWFADTGGMERRVRSEKLRHYRYRRLVKPSGGMRVIEIPKPRLKALQRAVLDEIVGRIAPHDAVHGFRRGRSIATNAQRHVGQEVVVRLDLEDFFPSITVARVRGVLTAVGYPRRVAELLAGLCTNAVPSEVLEGLPTGSRDATMQRLTYAAPHLPQGGPCSPALANLVAYRLDCRLTGLSRAAGATYTRYADDLVFSGGRQLARSVKRFATSVAATVMEEGFTVNFRKTRVMRQAHQQLVAGVVVNRHPNMDRREYDRLKAILTNCVRHGAETQNRGGHPQWREHLHGRVAHVASINPQRALRLRELLEQIDWQPGG